MPKAVRNSAATVAAIAQLQEQAKALPEIRSDIKTMLVKVEGIEIRLAKTPTFEDLSPLKSDINSLQIAKSEAKAGWRTLTVLGGFTTGVATVIYYCGHLLTSVGGAKAVDAATKLLNK